MNKENDPAIDEVRELYETLERDKNLYKEFLNDEESFLINRGLDPKVVKGKLKKLFEDRMNIFKEVLESHNSELSKKD